MTGRHGRGTVTGLSPIVVREVYVDVAAVSVSDAYGVELRQEKRLVEYSPSEAIDLANALVRAADAAKAAAAEDEARWADAPSHGFDVAPVCRECDEGKHGACNGYALVEIGSEGHVESVACGCAGAAHKLFGALAAEDPWRSAKVGEVWLIDWRTEADGEHHGDRAVKVSSGHFDLLGGDGYVRPVDVFAARREAVGS